MELETRHCPVRLPFRSKLSLLVFTGRDGDRGDRVQASVCVCVRACAPALRDLRRKTAAACVQGSVEDAVTENSY